MSSLTRLGVLVLGLSLGFGSLVAAQPLGVFRWQFQPYCNVVTLAVTQNGTIYTLDGTDDQCGTGAQASVTGTAFVNPGGNIGMGLSIVSAPGGAPVHVDTTISLAGLSGTWRDSAGVQGTFVYNPGAVSGSPRPTSGRLGTSAIDTTQIQSRITGTCATGTAMVSVAENGSVSCTGSGGGGTITGISPGVGLTGGGTSGNVTLGVSFAGPGSAASVARSDHTHQAPAGLDNTAVGAFTMTSLTTGARNSAFGRAALFAVSTGSSNTAVGFQALNTLSSGDDNTAVGQRTMIGLTTGTRNTAIGTDALRTDTNGVANVALGWRALLLHNGGNGNTAVGDSAMTSYPTGGLNTAIGYGALSALTSGQVNLAIGQTAGQNLSSGSNNVYLANEGLNGDESTIRIGSGLLGHNKIFLAATRGVQTGVNNAAFVMIDSNGQLGTISSSRRTKDHIENLGAVSRAIFDLRPVQFTYKQPFADGSRPIQYGLIAEEVAEVLPELVAFGADGEPETVKYHVLPTLVLAEVQRLERERAELASEVAALQKEKTALARRLAVIEERLGLAGVAEKAKDEK